ncbi:uncharacterized protein [Diabrotica undecimpunctata]|uniref:uncharacterized protein n=1 Tax=Diabrotica undecimpunctata TaxID=50387 RepID=UPI003B633439
MNANNYVFSFNFKAKMEETRRKREMKMAVCSYLQRRNYNAPVTFLATRQQQRIYSSIHTAIGRSNSILPICDSSVIDPVIIDQNFTKLLMWLREQTKFKNRFHDIEYIIAPLFCHIFTEFLRFEHTDKAATFFKCHFPSINENKCDNTIKELILCNGEFRPKDAEVSKFKEKFKKNRIVIKLSPESFKSLKKFVYDNCHIVFVQVLHTYFDFQVVVCPTKLEERTMYLSEKPKENKCQKMFNVMKELNKLPPPICKLSISNNNYQVSCGIIKRQSGVVIFGESNVLRIMPIHSFDSILNLDSTNQITFTHHSNYICAVDISRDNSTLVTTSADNTLCIYDLTDFRLVKKCLGHVNPVYCVKISNNGTYVATGSGDTTARLWDISTGKQLRVYCGHSQSVTCVTFHPNCLYLATGSADKNIRLWCVNKAVCVRLMHASKGTINHLTFGPCGKLLASASEDKNIKIFEVLTSKIIAELRCKEFHIVKVVWNKTGSEICAGTLEGVVKVWNVARLKENCDNNKYIESMVTYPIHSNLLDIEYAFGTYAVLTIDKQDFYV